jgi:hypothetical protein
MLHHSVLVCSFVACLGSSPTQPANPADPGDPRIEESVAARMLYNYERPLREYRDLVALRTGEKRLGKALEWGTYVLLYDAVGRRRVYPSSEIASIEIRRDQRLTIKPVLPDLTVACVSPIHNTSESAEKTLRWRVRLLNAGEAPSFPFDYRVLVDDQPIASGRIERAMEKGEAAEFEVALMSEPGPSTELRIELDTQNRNTEIARWNNTHVQALKGAGLLVIVPADVRSALGGVRNMVDTFCFEDWLQYHVRLLNWLFARSIYPTSPSGIHLRVRIDRIEIADDYPVNTAERNSWLSDRGLLRDSYAGVLWLDEELMSSRAARSASLVNWLLLHRMAKLLGLTSQAVFDLDVSDCLLRDSTGFYVQRGYRVPDRSVMMIEAGPFLFSEIEAHYLNRAVKHGFARSGAYLHDLPRTCGLAVIDAAGRPLADVEVEVIQRSMESEYAGAIGPQPIYLGRTDAQGRFPLIARDAPVVDLGGGYASGPNPWGPLSEDGANGLFLVRLRKNRAEEFHFCTILDFNKAAVRGHRDEYSHPVEVRLSDAASINATRTMFVRYDHADPTNPLVWLVWTPVTGINLLEYRLYARNGRYGGGWKLIDAYLPPPDAPSEAVVRTVPVAPLADGTPEFDPVGRTYLSVSAVDAQGRDGPLAPHVYAMYGSPAVSKLAIGADGACFFSLAGPTRFGLVRSNLGSMHEDFGLRTRGFGGYEPWGGGLAFDRRQRMLMTDPHHHVLGWYEGGDLLRLVGRRDDGSFAASDRPGFFDTPSDVAVDQDGRVYVADTGNNRVQMLDEDGKFLRELAASDEEAASFDKPLALGFAHGRLCVTDMDDKRVQIFDVTAEPPRLVRVLRGLQQADRALVGASGRVYVLGMSERNAWAVLVYSERVVEEDEKPERVNEYTVQGRVRRPRGLYHDGQRNAMFVSNNPIVVHRIALD